MDLNVGMTNLEKIVKLHGMIKKAWGNKQVADAYGLVRTRVDDGVGRAIATEILRHDPNAIEAWDKMLDECGKSRSRGGRPITYTSLSVINQGRTRYQDISEGGLAAPPPKLLDSTQWRGPCRDMEHWLWRTDDRNPFERTYPGSIPYKARTSIPKMLQKFQGDMNRGVPISYDEVVWIVMWASPDHIVQFGLQPVMHTWRVINEKVNILLGNDPNKDTSNTNREGYLKSLWMETWKPVDHKAVTTITPKPEADDLDTFMNGLLNDPL